MQRPSTHWRYQRFPTESKQSTAPVVRRKRNTKRRFSIFCVSCRCSRRMASEVERYWVGSGIKAHVKRTLVCTVLKLIRRTDCWLVAFSVVSYNVLADCLVDPVLHRYSPPGSLNWDDRAARLLKEFKGRVRLLSLSLSLLLKDLLKM